MRGVVSLCLFDLKFSGAARQGVLFKGFGELAESIYIQRKDTDFQCPCAVFVSGWSRSPFVPPLQIARECRQDQCENFASKKMK